MPQFDRWDEEWYPGRGRREDTLGFDTPFADPTTTPPPPTDQTPPSDFGTYEAPSYGGSSSPMFQFGMVPEFDAPRFDAPSFQDAQNEPGYQFRLDAGRQALERSAAARGTLRTGGTLKDLIEYGQDFGAQEYSNVFNRALQGYGANYQASKDEFAPYFAQYQNQFGAEQARGMAEFQRQMELYNAQMEDSRFREGLGSGFLNDPYPTFPGSY